MARRVQSKAESSSRCDGGSRAVVQLNGPFGKDIPISLHAAGTNRSTTTQKEDTMTPSASEQRSEQATDKTAIRTFRVNVQDAELTELRRRITETGLSE